ncbi:MAG: DUF99 family protein [Candidatus Bathyarchaeota archaeon]
MLVKHFRSIKPEIRTLGIDDGCFIPKTKGTVDIVGVVYRGASWFEGFIHSMVTIDGLDAIEKIVSMVKTSSFYNELRVIFLDGISFGGFNVVDLNKLYCLLDLPVISVTREKPDLKSIKFALHNLSDFDVRWQSILNCGKLIEVKIREIDNPIYIQIAGILEEDAKKIIRKMSTKSNIPEPLRIAHLIASGLTVQ